MSDTPKPLVHKDAGSEPTIHHTAAETRERTYERARSGGLAPDAARKVAEDVGRRFHDNLDRRGR